MRESTVDTDRSFIIIDIDFFNFHIDEFKVILVTDSSNEVLDIFTAGQVKFLDVAEIIVGHFDLVDVIIIFSEIYGFLSDVPFVFEIDDDVFTSPDETLGFVDVLIESFDSQNTDIISPDS